jgi:uncharacterized protein (DUF58 family)
LKKIGNFFISLKQGKFLFAGFIICILFFIIAAVFPAISIVPRILLGIFTLALTLDFLLLYFTKQKLMLSRQMPNRLSNGDALPVKIEITNNFGYPINIQLIEELPEQFQTRDFLIKAALKNKQTKELKYKLIPKERGEYNFGQCIVLVESFLRLWQRRYVAIAPQPVLCYPAYLQLKNYQVMAEANRLNEIGIKKTRKLGASTEFEQIKEYIQGDDVRTINWKATARKGQIMVNNYTDEKSQQIYCVINKSRVMRMPFEGLSLLDYAINASLVLSHVVLSRQDRIGLITYAEKNDSLLLANKKPGTMNRIQELLYKQQTTFLDSDLEKLYNTVRTNVTHRSLLILFTNYETLPALYRDLPILRKLNKYHLLLIVLFENTELEDIHSGQNNKIAEVYEKSIAEKFILEKKLIVKELNKFGILAILTAPKKLTVNVINKYVELKNKSKI